MTSELKRDDLGLSIDMRDVDQLRELSGLIVMMTAFRGEAVWMRSLADRMEATVKEIGELREIIRDEEDAQRGRIS